MVTKVIKDYIGAPEAEQLDTMRRANERRAAEVAVIQAAREVIAKGAWWVNPSRNAEKFNTDATAALNLANTLAALAALDALDAPAPDDTLVIPRERLGAGDVAAT